MLEIAICDDDSVSRMNLEKLSLRTLDCHTQCFSSGLELLKVPEQFDIILLDIRTKDIDGMTTARKIREKSDAAIIFITASKEHVFDAFDVGAFHYFMKPVEKEKFCRVLKKAAEERENKKSQEPLLIKSGSHYHKIPVNDIFYAESNGRKIILHTMQERIEFYGKMADLEEQLGETFFRCHRGYLVNLRMIEGYDNSSISLQNGEKIYLAKQKFHLFAKQYMEFLKK